MLTLREKLCVLVIFFCLAGISNRLNTASFIQVAIFRFFSYFRLARLRSFTLEQAQWMLYMFYLSSYLLNENVSEYT